MITTWYPISQDLTGPVTILESFLPSSDCFARVSCIDLTLDPIVNIHGIFIFPHVTD